MRRALLVLAMVACDTPQSEPPCVPDAMHRCVTWTWDFVDHATGKPAPCPREVTAMHLSAEYRGFVDSSEIIEPRGEMMASCGTGSATFLVRSGGNFTRLDALESGRIYGRASASLADGDAFATSFETAPGYVDVAWTIYSESQQRVLTCGEASQLSSAIRRLRLTTTNADDATDVSSRDVDCDAGEASTIGRQAGTYLVRLTGRAVNGFTTATADAGPITVSARQITDAGTLTLMAR